MKKFRNYYNVFISSNGDIWEQIDGNIYSNDINKRYPRCKIANIHYDKYGYAIYTMRKDVCSYNKLEYTTKKYKVHRLVAEAYIPSNNLNLHIDHIDRNPKNNNVNNLRWVNYTQNNNNKGNQSKYTYDQKMQVLKLLFIDNKSCKEVGIITGVKVNSVTSAKQGRCWLKERQLLI